MNLELLIGALFSGAAVLVTAIAGLVKVIRTSRSDLTDFERKELSYFRELVLVLRAQIYRLKAVILNEGEDLPSLPTEPKEPIMAERRDEAKPV